LTTPAARAKIDWLLRVFGGDVDAVRRHLEVDAKLALIRFRPAPPKPRRPEVRYRNVLEMAAAVAGHPPPDLEGKHIASLIAAGVIDATGRRAARDEHGRRIFRDPDTGRWYYEENSGRRVWLRDDG